MEDHLDALLSRSVAGRVTAAEAAAVAAHLEHCERCRAQAAALREADRLLARSLPTPPPAGAGQVLEAVAAQRRRTRLATVGLAVLALLQVAAAVWLLATPWSDRLATGLFAGFLLADAVLLSAVALLLRARGSRLQMLDGEWNELQRRWREELELRRRSHRVLFAVAFVLLTNGALQLWLGVARPERPLHAAIGAASLLLGAFVSWWAPRVVRRTDAELERLERLA